jgi:hypothetical protein
VTYKDVEALNWTLGFIWHLHSLEFLITIYFMALSQIHIYSLLSNSVSHIVHFTARIESFWFAVPHQSSGIGFHRPSFSLGSRSVPVPHPQRLLAYCALTRTSSSGSSCNFVRSNKYSRPGPPGCGSLKWDSMAVSSAGLWPKSDCSGKSQKQLYK